MTNLSSLFVLALALACIALSSGVNLDRNEKKGSIATAESIVLNKEDPEEEMPADVHSLPLFKITSRPRAIKSSIASAKLTNERFAHGLYRPRPILAKLLAKFNLGDAGTPVINLPMGGNIWPIGGFYTKIYVGTPPQPQLVQIDTGSSDLLVAQKGCNGCPNSVQYDPTASRTSISAACNSPAFHCPNCLSGNRCGFNNTYQTCDYADPEAACSLLGPTYFDIFSVGEASPKPSVKIGFGGIAQHAGAPDNEWTNMPGVMGMAYPKLAGVWLKNTPFDSLVQSKQLANVFAMCLSPQGGVITLGGIDSRYYAGSIQWTPIKNEMWYVLNMTDLSVDGRTIGLPSSMYNQIGGGTILDSGTNTFVVNSEAYDIIFARFIDYCTVSSLVGVCDVLANLTIFHPGTCFHMTQSDIDAYPTVSVTLENTGLLSLSGRDYLLPHPELDGRYCMGIQPSGLGGFTILGNVFQNPFYTIFDRQNKRLGFARSANCSA